MKIFEKFQEKELRKISEYIVSKDPEILKLGIECLRTSNTYKNLKPLSLFYYPEGNNFYKKVRLSTFINRNIKCLISDTCCSYDKTVVRSRLSRMFNKLLGDDVHKYFRREFINTAKFL